MPVHKYNSGVNAGLLPESLVITLWRVDRDNFAFVGTQCTPPAMPEDWPIIWLRLGTIKAVTFLFED